MTELSLKHLATANYIINISRAKENFIPSLLEVTHLIGDAIFVSVCLRDGRHVNGNYGQSTEGTDTQWTTYRKLRQLKRTQ
jgi:hypothetical protein